jgi:hypothetical protein
MFGRLGAAFKGWNERRRQYQIERALYKAGGGTTPHGQASRYGPLTATHAPPVKTDDPHS